MINPTQLRDTVIIPVLTSLVTLQHDQSGGANGAAVEILLGTGMQESHLGDYLHQISGPALGIYQMEPATEKDIWDNYLAYRPDLRVPVGKLAVTGIDRTSQLAGNLYYATAMARIQYMRITAPLPKAGDFEGQAAYYVKHYNAGGKATVQEYIDNWHALQLIMLEGSSK